MRRFRAYVRQHHLALLALFVALGGTSYAVTRLPANSVGTRQIKNGAVTSSKVKDQSLLAGDFKPGQLPQGKTGPTGPTGPAGSGHAYGLVTKSGTLITTLSRNVVSVYKPTTGLYCITLAAGIDPADAVATANNSFDDTTTGGPATTDKLTYVELRGAGNGCPAGTLAIKTGYAQPSTGNTDANEPFFFLVP
jgi:hypothetical protein